MPDKCLLLLLDGLGDRSLPELGGRTPLQAAHTPNMDRLAAAGGNGLFHAARMGQALPSENAHFTIFGYGLEEFPGRGALEALGAGLELGTRDVAILAHLCSVAERDGALWQERDIVPEVTEEEAAQLMEAVGEYASDGVEVRLLREKGLFGVLRLRGKVSRHVTDTNTMRDGVPMSAVEAWREYENDSSTVRTVRVLKGYLSWAWRTLEAHPVNAARRERGQAPVTGVVTQRAGRRKLVTPFAERYGLRGMTVASDTIYMGLAEYLGLSGLRDADTGDPGTDFSRRIGLAREALAEHDYVHVHTKAPDVAAHTKDPARKVEVIEALDRALGEHLEELLADESVLLALTSDHSTPSCGALVHSGEPVPLTFAGRGVRVDGVDRFDEVSAASGALGTVRGREFMFLVLNYLDKAKLGGIRDTPLDQAFWPGNYKPFVPDPS